MILICSPLRNAWAQNHNKKTPLPKKTPAGSDLILFATDFEVHTQWKFLSLCIMYYLRSGVHCCAVLVFLVEDNLTTAAAVHMLQENAYFIQHAQRWCRYQLPCCSSSCIASNVPSQQHFYLCINYHKLTERRRKVCTSKQIAHTMLGGCPDPSAGNTLLRRETSEHYRKARHLKHYCCTARTSPKPRHSPPC